MRTFIFIGQIVFEAEDIDDARKRLAKEIASEFDEPSIALAGTDYEIRPKADRVEEQS